jgi:hypothetical protein
MELLLLSLFSLEKWEFVEEMLNIYGNKFPYYIGIDRPIGASQFNFSARNLKKLIRKKMANVVKAEIDAESKFMFGLIKQRFDRIKEHSGQSSGTERRNFKVKNYI